MSEVREMKPASRGGAVSHPKRALAPGARQRRSAWFQIHFWIGWIAAAPLLAICATGIALSFEEELYALEQPEHYALTPKGDPLSLPEVLDLYEAARPRLHLNFLQVPTTPHHAYLAFATELGEGGAPDRGLRAYLDPYSGEIQREFDNPTWARRFEVWHRTLAAGKIGRWIMGGSSLLLAVTSLVGLVLWWPMRGRTLVRAWRRGGALDWHNALGLIGLVPLLVLGITGATFTWGKQVFPVLDKLQGKPSQVEAPLIESQGGEQDWTRASLASIAQKIAAEFPDKRIVGLQGSRKPSKAYSFNLRGPEDFHPGGNLRLFFDPTTGEEVSRINPAETGPVGWYRRYFYILHTGHPFPAWVRSGWGAASLIGCILVGTGMWLSIRRWKRQKARGAAAHG